MVVYPSQDLQQGSVYKMCNGNTAKYLMLTSTLDKINSDSFHLTFGLFHKVPIDEAGVLG